MSNGYITRQELSLGLKDELDGIHAKLATNGYFTPQPGTGPLLPLSNAAYGKLKYKLYGRTYVNMVENGNFKNGTAGWEGVNSSLTVTSNKLMIMCGDNTNAPRARRSMKIVSVEGKRLFLRFRGKVTNSEALHLSIRLSGSIAGAEWAINISPTPNVVQDIFVVYTLPASIQGLLNVECAHRYADAATAKGKTMEIQEVMCLDLDQYPWLKGLTAEEIHAQIPHYIDRMQSVNNVKMVSVGKNLIVNGNCELGISNWISENPNTSLKVENGKFKSVTTSIASTYRQTIKVIPNTQYVLSGIVEDGTSVASIKLINKETGAHLATLTKTTPYVVFNSKTATEIVISMNHSGVGYCYFSRLQLEKGSSPTPYEPYGESVVFLDRSLRSLPNGVKDELDSEGNLIRRVGEIVLERGDFIKLVTDLTYVDVINIALDKMTNLKGYSTLSDEATQFQTSVSIPRNNLALDSVECYWRHQLRATAFQIIFPKGTFSSLAAAQAALEGTVIQYELENPILEKVDIGPVSSLKDGTLILQNKYKYILKAEDITHMFTSLTKIDWAVVPKSKLVDFILQNDVSINTIKINGMLEDTIVSNSDHEKNIGKYSTVHHTTYLIFVFPKGTTLQQAREQLAGLEIEYETIPSPLPEVEYAYPINLAAGIQGNSVAIAQLGRIIENILEKLKDHENRLLSERL